MGGEQGEEKKKKKRNKLKDILSFTNLRPKSGENLTETVGKGEEEGLLKFKIK